ncbi:hypothetical protein CDD82_1990 [Ophiocordyceps australis]|uniref:C3HC-type domain-containing protein n=1 Tax=Ophiocordyceps australis TaxID=1399860 RepID=A0A2C5YPN9_9HYPO|nr:hypothetical protein CDD82_1990 [Ophiocordyceps australis]
MHATKRKLNALLQELGSSRSEANSGIVMDPDSSPTSHQDLLAKRRRLGFPEATAPVQPVSSLSSLSSSPKGRRTATATTIASTTTTTPDTTETLSKYCPGDRHQLLKRLATFQELTDWTPKPDKVGEVQWAKRGWICHGKETVRCLLCHKQVVVKLDYKEPQGQDASALASAEVENALEEKYAELIVSSHQQDCLWRRRGCDDALLRISFSNAKATFTALRERYDELCARHASLPYEFNLRLPPELDIDQVLSQLPPGFFSRADKPAKSGSVTITTTAVDQPVNRAALALALTGWQGLTNRRIGTVANSASCHTCLRRLGLWMFRSKEVDQNGHILTPAPMDFLDPLAEHRSFCPWTSPETQSKGGPQAADFAGWQALLQSVRNESSLRSVYAGRSHHLAATTTTTVRETTPSIHSTVDEAETGLAVEADDKARDAKDKERWARLRKVKSMLNTKKLRRSTVGKPESIKSNHSSGG